MENENIIIKGTPKKNKVALIILLSGIAVAVISFIVASYYFYNDGVYESFGFGYGEWHRYCEIYDFDFFKIDLTKPELFNIKSFPHLPY